MAKTKNGDQLIRKLKHGDIKAWERDKLGRCPVLFSIDADMDLVVVKELIEGCNCDAKTADVGGDTALHYAVNMERNDIAEYLIERCEEEYKEMKNKAGEKPYQ